jgi:hypothetical protein
MGPGIEGTVIDSFRETILNKPTEGELLARIAALERRAGSQGELEARLQAERRGWVSVYGVYVLYAFHVGFKRGNGVRPYAWPMSCRHSSGKDKHNGTLSLKPQ